LAAASPAAQNSTAPVSAAATPARTPAPTPSCARATPPPQQAVYSSNSPHSQYMGECETIITQVAIAPQRREAVQRKLELREQLDAAMETGNDYDRVGILGEQLDALERDSAQLPLSEEDYLTLPDRHAALLSKVEARCKEYKANKQAALLIELGTKLSALKTLDLSVCPEGTRGESRQSALTLLRSH
jgi:hypothetical protein